MLQCYQTQFGSLADAVLLLKTTFVLALVSASQNSSPPFLIFNNCCVLL